MKSVDLSNNKTIESLSALAVELRKTATPIETLNTVRRGFEEAFGAGASVMLSTSGLPAGQYRVLQIDLPEQRVSLTEESMSHDSLDIHQHGVISQIVSCSKPQILSDVDWASDPCFGQQLAGYGSVMAVPLRSENLPMNWIVFLQPTDKNFTIQELEELILRTVLIGSLMDSQALAEQLSRANRHIEIEMREVGALQRVLLPDPLPRVPGLEFAVSYEPSGRAGGDLYDVFPLDDSRWCILIGDASGHGIAAAVVMAIIHSLLHAHPQIVSGPAGLLAHANRHLCEKNLGGFVTLFLAVYESKTRRLVYSSAGHPPPIYKSADGNDLSELNGAGTHPIGIDADQTFREAGVQFRSGDVFLLYTDGVTEARNPRGELLELGPVKRVVIADDAAPAELVTNVRRLVKDHEQTAVASDDQTMLVVAVL